jgi:flagellar biosynthesis/type III secretory pathway chaperone
LASIPAAPTPAPDPSTAPGTDPIQDLLAILDAQATVYGHLLQVAIERHSALAAADADRLSELAEREEPLLSRSRRLESARLQVIRPWAQHLQREPERIAASDLISLLDQPTADALLAARDRLMAAVEDVAKANERNAALLEFCLGSINDSVQHLLETVQLDPRYASTGSRAGQDATPRLTDYRA